MLSICIVNWNTKTYLRECLASIEAYPPLDDTVEVIVVDNASSDGSAAMVRDEFPTYTLIANYHNASYAAGNNQAMARATGDTMLLLNPDVLLGPGALTTAIAFLDAHPEAGAVGVRQIGADGHTQRSLRAFPEPMSVLYEALGLGKLFPRSRTLAAYRMGYFDYDKSGEADQPMGTFLLFRREVYEAVGGMDEAFPLFFNDVDWCYRVKQKGWKILYTPDAEIIHYGGSGTGQAPKPSIVRESHRSLIKFYEKHYHDRFRGPAFGLVKTAIIAAEGLRIAAGLRGQLRKSSAARKNKKQKLLGPPPPVVTPDKGP